MFTTIFDSTLLEILKYERAGAWPEDFMFLVKVDRYHIFKPIRYENHNYLDIDMDCAVTSSLQTSRERVKYWALITPLAQNKKQEKILILQK